MNSVLKWVLIIIGFIVPGFFLVNYMSGTSGQQSILESLFSKSCSDKEVTQALIENINSSVPALSGGQLKDALKVAILNSGTTKAIAKNISGVELKACTANVQISFTELGNKNLTYWVRGLKENPEYVKNLPNISINALGAYKFLEKYWDVTTNFATIPVTYMIVDKNISVMNQDPPILTYLNTFLNFVIEGKEDILKEDFSKQK